MKRNLVRMQYQLIRDLRIVFRLPSAWVRILPDFLVIGVMRGGTSSLYNYLIQHPCILPTTRKEVHYFDAIDQKISIKLCGIYWYRAHFPTRFVKQKRASQCTHRLITGEATPYYIFHPKAPVRIRSLLPEVKLIVLLRNPVDRAYSHYHHSVRKGYERLSFIEAIKREMEWLESGQGVGPWAPFPDAFSHQHFSYLSRGLYAQQLKRWYELFPRKQILVLSSEQMFVNPDQVLRQVFDFLELPSISIPDTTPRNIGGYSPMSADVRRWLAKFFEPHNQELYELLGVDFGWEER